jgi:glycosyltransferase involved in cell wall biosynthesis
MKSTMRILFCNYEYPPLGGGGGVINALLAEEMAKRHEVTVLTSQGLGLPPERIENGVRVLRVPVFFRKEAMAANLLSMLAYLPMGVRRGKALLAGESFDVINTHFVLPTGPVGDALARFGKIPNVLSLHGGDLYDPSKAMSPHRHPLLRAWIRRLLRRADRIVGQSTNTIENMRRFYASELKAAQIPLGIKRPKREAAFRKEYRLGEEEVLLVTVGRLVARKAVPQLISMMASMRNEKVRLLIIGTGPQERELKEACFQKGLAEKVLFLGHVEEGEKFRILQMSDLYVSTSQHEGFGLVFLEAMASGLPVVCYNHGGQTDFLEDKATGALLPLNDQAGFERACRALVLDRRLRRQIAEENLKRVEEFFIDRCAERYEAVFSEAIAAFWKKGLNGDADRP